MAMRPHYMNCHRGCGDLISPAARMTEQQQPVSMASPPPSRELADNPCRQEIEGIPTMAGLHGDDEPQAKWITVRLFGGGDRDDDQAKLLVAEDDAYVAGFANRTGHWHTFRGGRCYPALPATACTELPFGGSYRDLIGGVANLRAVPVGR
uniref:rRNA N-glycosylase n=1 Tax=Oryza glumipatula TaxID=40148 RepID=A0A0E0BE10_9ORYZ